MVVPVPLNGSITTSSGLTYLMRSWSTNPTENVEWFKSMHSPFSASK